MKDMQIIKTNLKKTPSNKKSGHLNNMNKTHKEIGDKNFDLLGLNDYQTGNVMIKIVKEKRKENYKVLK